MTSIRVSGVHHEFSPIPTVREDTTALLLNVKQLRLKSEIDEPVRLHVEVRSEGPVTAGDLVYPPEVEIVNPELLLLTADSPEVDLDLELTVSRGRGYSPAEERGKLPLGEIPVDAIYSSRAQGQLYCQPGAHWPTDQLRPPDPGDLDRRYDGSGSGTARIGQDAGAPSDAGRRR